MKKILTTLFRWVIYVVVFSFIIFTAVVLARNYEADKWSSLVDSYREQIPKISNEKKEDIIKRVCDETGVPWIQCVLVANCESRNDKYFKEKVIISDKTTGKRIVSYDRGIFAINSYHYKQVEDECAFDVECSTRVFAQAVSEGKAGDWLCYRTLGFK
jgi:hypothetical protein